MKLVVILCIFGATVAKGPIPLVPCKTGAPDLYDCARNHIQKFIEVSGVGLPDWKVPSGDPYVIPNLFIGGGGGSVNVDQNYTNMHVYGISKAKVLNMTVDGIGTETIRMRLTVFGKRVVLASQYTMKGRVLILPLTGSGKSLYTLDNLYVEVDAYTEPYQKKSKTYIRIKDFKVTLKPTSLKIELENLFDGNRELGQQMNNLLNQEWQVVFEEMRSPYEMVVTDYLRKYIDKMLSFYELSELLVIE